MQPREVAGEGEVGQPRPSQAVGVERHLSVGAGQGRSLEVVGAVGCVTLWMFETLTPRLLWGGTEVGGDPYHASERTSGETMRRRNDRSVVSSLRD